MQEIQFDYYRGMEAEQYTFYRIPKVLFTAECFKSLSCEAKVLYGLLLDRMSLSIKNRWFDEEDRVYIIFTVEEIMELMCCKTQKAVKLMKELDSDGGIGLIEKKRLGLGKPNVIYVKNFLIKEVEPSPEADEPSGSQQETGTQQGQEMKEMGGNTQSFQSQKSGVLKIKNPEFPESKVKNFENQKSGVLKIENQEFPESKIKNGENHTSGISEIKNQELRFSKPNDTDINKTDYSNTDLSETDISETDTIQSNLIPSEGEDHLDRIDVIEKMSTYRELIRENIDYQYHAGEDVDELVELMVEVMMMPDDSILRIAGVDKPVALVKNRFMKLNFTHIEYVLFCLHRNTSKVGNIKAYLLTTLYNASLTISNFYQAEVNHDMYGGG